MIKTEWLRMELVWVPDEAEEQILESVELVGRAEGSAFDFKLLGIIS